MGDPVQDGIWGTGPGPGRQWALTPTAADSESRVGPIWSRKPRRLRTGGSWRRHGGVASLPGSRSKPTRSRFLGQGSSSACSQPQSQLSHARWRASFGSARA